MPPSDRLPDRAEQARRFAALDNADRRQIVRAVNRGRALENRKLAGIAVGLARRQQRFWRWAWLVAPAIGVVQLWFLPVREVLANMAIATIGLGLLAAFWYHRARRAEMLNIDVVDRKGIEDVHPRQRRRDDEDPDEDTVDAPELIPHIPRGPRPRGKKRT